MFNSLRRPSILRPFTQRRHDRARSRPFRLEMLEARDAPAAGVLVNPTTAVTRDNGGAALVSVKLLQAPTADVAISLTSDNTDEGIVSVPSLTFTPANWNMAQRFRVIGQHDGIPGGDVTYHVITGAAVSDDPAYNGLDAADITLTNRVTQPKLLAGVIVKTTRQQSTGDGGAAAVTLKLTVKPHADVTFSVASDNPKEGLPNVSSVTFTPDNWNLAQTVLVTGQADGLKGGSVKYHVVFGATVSDDARYNGLAVSPVTLTNVRSNKFYAAIVVKPTAGLKTGKDGHSAAFTIVLNYPPAADVTIPLSSSNPSEGVADVSSVTFTPDNWNVPQQVTVTGHDDGLFNGDVKYSIITGAAQSDDPLYSGLDAKDVALVNVHRADICRFDGHYVGSYAGILTEKNGQKLTVSGPVDAMIEAGVITVKVRIFIGSVDEGLANGSGTLSITGTAGFAHSDGAVAGATFAGGLTAKIGTSDVTGRGSWRFSGSDAVASGTWNVSRVGRWDGQYVGSYAGSIILNGVRQEITGNVNAIVDHNSITVHVTIVLDGQDAGIATGSGSVTSSGNMDFALAGGSVDGAVFNGTVEDLFDNCQEFGNGSWSLVSLSGGGSWNVHRV